jgi:3-deoxy-manno-octulosonate cytidylyltransferase (CMP-KDO synthetase)
MIQRVYECAASVLENIVVATDDERIEKVIKDFGGNVVMTSDKHRNGTDRCAEAFDKLYQITGKEYSVVINIQGDEPFLKSAQIDSIKKCFEDENTQIATLIKPIDNNSVIFNPNRPKVIVDRNGFALYFSRSPIPFVRDADKSTWNNKHLFFQHFGMYAYRKEVLKEIAILQPGELEKAESLEQLRWLENGYKIKTAVTEFESYGIDTPEDLKRVIKMKLMDE